MVLSLASPHRQWGAKRNCASSRDLRQKVNSLLKLESERKNLENFDSGFNLDEVEVGGFCLPICLAGGRQG